MRLHDLRQIHDNYQHIYLSPHFDDVALSCGGMILRQRSQGQGVLVVTICSAMPDPDRLLNQLAQQIHASWNLRNEQVVAIRRGEDAAAMERLDADYYYLDLLDAIYRLPDYDSREILFGGALVPDDLLPSQVTTALRTIQERVPHAIIYAPLGVGGHVDHQATFLVCEQLAHQGRPVMFYEDIPYVLKPGVAEQRHGQLLNSLACDLVAIDPFLEGKFAAIEAYVSQLGELFGTSAAMREAVAAYARTAHPEGSEYGERLWRSTGR